MLNAIFSSYGAPLILILIHNFILSQQIPNTIRQSLVISYREITVFLFGVFTVQVFCSEWETDFLGHFETEKSPECYTRLEPCINQQLQVVTK